MKASLLLLFVLSAFAEQHAPTLPVAPPPRPVGVVEQHNFNTGRNLGQYACFLGPDFIHDLGRLGANGHWVDLGSGEGTAIENYFQFSQNEPSPALQRAVSRISQCGRPHGDDFLTQIGRRPIADRARVTGITYRMKRQPPDTGGDRLRMLTGRFFEDIPAKELGNADLMTDVFGVLAYTHKLDVALEKSVNMLNRGGKIYFMYNFQGTSENRIRMPDGGSLTIPEWLQTVPGIRTSVERFEGMSTIRIERTAASVRFPRLELTSTDDEMPPVRIFRQLP